MPARTSRQPKPSPTYLPGAHWLLREKRKDPSSEQHHVEIIDGLISSQQVKVLFVEGSREGLRSWVRTQLLLTEWKDRDRFLRDEQRRLALERDGERFNDEVLIQAVGEVTEAAGEETPLGTAWSGSEEMFRRLWARAGLETDPHPRHQYRLAYKSGPRVHLPFEAAIDFAVAFCRAEPELVMTHVDEQEKELLARGYMPGNRTAHRLLRNYSPAFAIIREWVGYDRNADRLATEVERLHRLLAMAVHSLETAGADDAARRLNLAIRGS